MAKISTTFSRELARHRSIEILSRYYIVFLENDEVFNTGIPGWVTTLCEIPERRVERYSLDHCFALCLDTDAIGATER